MANSDVQASPTELSSSALFDGPLGLKNGTANLAVPIWHRASGLAMVESAAHAQDSEIHIAGAGGNRPMGDVLPWIDVVACGSLHLLHTIGSRCN